MDVVGVMAAYLPVVRVYCTSQRGTAYGMSRQDRTITVILAKHCIELPDYGSLVIRNMLEQF